MKIILMLFAIILFIGCHSSKVASISPVPKNPLAVLNGNWQLELLFASNNKWTDIPYVELNVADKTFTGNTGCNSIKGSFTVKEDFFVFDKQMVTTKKACINYNENAFISALLKINQYNIENNKLELMQNAIVIMKFKRK